MADNVVQLRSPEMVSALAKLSGAQRPGLRDFYQIYVAHYQEVANALLDGLRIHPQWGPIIKSMPQAVMDEQNRIALENLRRAIIDDDWQPLLSNLRMQGVQYAQMGLSFAAWYEILGAFRGHLVPILIKELGSTDRFTAALLAMDVYVDVSMAVVGDAYLERKEEQIRRQQSAIMELSAPVLPVRERLLLQPIVGLIDTHRARQITDGLLQAIRSHRAKVVVIDITGVPAVDSKVANHLLQTAAAARLMGAVPIMTGMSAEVAQALVALGVDLGQIATVGDLRGGIEEAERILGLQLIETPPATTAHTAPPAA
jgi:rsbT co-antagonist protein RsbR